MLIRKAVPEDLPVLTRLWIEFIDFHAGCDDYFQRSDDAPERFASYMAGNLDSSEWLVLVAEEAGEMFGYVMATVQEYPPVFRRRRYGLIQDLGISARSRRQGAGKALVDETMHWFMEQGVENVEIYAAHHNALAQSFWRKQGFRDVMDRMVLTLD